MWDTIWWWSKSYQVMIFFFFKVGKYITICQFLHKWQDLALQRHLITAEQRRRITSLDLLAVLPFIQPRMLFVFCAERTHCCLIFKMVAHQDPQIFFSKAAFYPVGHLCLLVHGVIPHQRQDFSYPCMRFFFTQFSNLSGSLKMAAYLSGISTTPPSFVPSANLLRVHSVPSFRLLIKKLNDIGPFVACL